MIIEHQPEFDYSVLDADAEREARAIAGVIRQEAVGIATGIVEIGKHLNQAKELLRGQFMDWLSAEFGWEYRTARRYMNVAERLDGLNLEAANVGPSALYLLAEPSTPEEVVEAVAPALEAGEPVTHKDVREAVREAKGIVYEDIERELLAFCNATWREETRIQMLGNVLGTRFGNATGKHIRQQMPEHDLDTLMRAGRTILSQWRAVDQQKQVDESQRRAEARGELIAWLQEEAPESGDRLALLSQLHDRAEAWGAMESALGAHAEWIDDVMIVELWNDVEAEVLAEVEEMEAEVSAEAPESPGAGGIVFGSIEEVCQGLPALSVDFVVGHAPRVPHDWFEWLRDLYEQLEHVAPVLRVDGTVAILVPLDGLPLGREGARFLRHLLGDNQFRNFFHVGAPLSLAVSMASQMDPRRGYMLLQWSRSDSAVAVESWTYPSPSFDDALVHLVMKLDLLGGEQPKRLIELFADPDEPVALNQAIKLGWKGVAICEESHEFVLQPR